MQAMTEESFENESSKIIIQHKVIIVGDICVGKTSIINSFLRGRAHDAYIPTIAVEFLSKVVRFRGEVLKFQIWDTAGQERFKSLTYSYVRGASIIFIAFDVSKPDSFKNVSTWIDFVKNNQMEGSLIVLCGNKIDMQSKVSTTEAQNFAKKEGLRYFEVSARKGDNILEMFYSAIADLSFFEQFDIKDKHKIIGELLNENHKYLDNCGYWSISKPRNVGFIENLNVMDSKGNCINSQKKRNCKC